MADCGLVSSLKKLQLTETSSLSLDKLSEDYVLDIATQPRGCSSCLLAATSSNNTIRLFSRSNLAGTGVVKGHDDTITGVCWGKAEPNLLFSSSQDKTIRCWDTRTKPCKQVQTFQGCVETDNVFTCVDVNSTGRVVCAGMEADKDDDVYVLFWDRRNADMMGAYSESHQGDITQVCFHPDNADLIASGSMDGLVCTFDLSQTNEDDALSYALNSCSTVARVGWCGEKRNNVYCTTHIDTLHVWDSVEGDPVLEITDLKEKLKGNNAIDYIVDCLPSSTSDLYVLAGTYSGDVRIVNCTEADVPCVTGTLSGGHKSTVRSMHWEPENETLVTGAEDSMLCLWSATPTSTTTDTPNKVHLKAKKTVSNRSRPYKKQNR